MALMIYITKILVVRLIRVGQVLSEASWELYDPIKIGQCQSSQRPTPSNTHHSTHPNHAK